MHRALGLYMFVLTRVRPGITDLKTDTVATGIGGVYGNKGAFSLRSLDHYVCLVSTDIDTDWTIVERLNCFQGRWGLGFGK